LHYLYPLLIVLKAGLHGFLILLQEGSHWLDKGTEQWLNGVVCTIIQGVLWAAARAYKDHHILTVNLDPPFLAPSL